MSQKNWNIAPLMGGLSLLVVLASCTVAEPTVVKQSESSTELDPPVLVDQSSGSNPAADIADGSADRLSTDAAPDAAISNDSESEIDPSDELISRTDTNGNLLPEIVDGLVVGMDYGEARRLIIGDTWGPKTVPLANLENLAVKSLYDAGYEEIRDCAGTGLGLCRMEFIEREGLVFVVIVTTSEDTPKVWTWSVE